MFSLARVISHWLESEPLRIWSFFFGLIFASALLLVRHVRRWSLPAVGGMLIAACVAVVIGPGTGPGVAGDPRDLLYRRVSGELRDDSARHLREFYLWYYWACTRPSSPPLRV